MKRIKKMPRPKKVIEQVIEPVVPVEYIKKGGYMATKDFGDYKAGQEFIVPDGWVLDETYKNISNKNKTPSIVFWTPNGRAILPLKEA